MAFNWKMKVAGVPVLYVAGGAVAILGVVAWRMKGAPGDTPDAIPAEDATLDENGIADGTNPYGGYSTNGTVIVQPSTPKPEDTQPDRPLSNDEWIREGAEWLMKNKNANSTAAYSALQKYIEGKSRSAQESEWINAVVGVQGYPPEPFINDAPTPSTPTPSSPSPMTPAPGSKVGYGWHKVVKGESAAFIASKYGISVNTFYAYNGKDRLVAGEYVKVRANSNPTWGYRG